MHYVKCKGYPLASWSHIPMVLGGCREYSKFWIHVQVLGVKSKPEFHTWQLELLLFHLFMAEIFQTSLSNIFIVKLETVR